MEIHGFRGQLITADNPDYDTVIRPLSTCVDAEHPPTFDKMLSGAALLFLYSRVWPSVGEPDKQSTY